jgi:hypothetical protein
MTPERWLEPHVAIVCYANGTYEGFGSGYPRESLGNAAFGGYEHYGIYSYPNKFLFKSLYADGLAGFDKANADYNNEKNLSEAFNLTQNELDKLGPSGHSLARFPYEAYTLPEKNVVYLVVFKAEMWAEQGMGCPPIKPI